MHILKFFKNEKNKWKLVMCSQHGTWMNGWFHFSFFLLNSVPCLEQCYSTPHPAARVHKLFCLLGSDKLIGEIRWCSAWLKQMPAGWSRTDSENGSKQSWCLNCLYLPMRSYCFQIFEIQFLKSSFYITHISWFSFTFTLWGYWTNLWTKLCNNFKWQYCANMKHCKLIFCCI